MAWREKNDMTQEQFERDGGSFKQFSIQYQCRVFIKTENEKYPYYLKGSGGFLKYRDRFFLVTNYHVVKDIPREKVVAFCVSNGNVSARLIDDKRNPETDMAVFRIPDDCVKHFKGKDFLTEGFIEREPIKHLQDMNSVFLNASPGETSEIEYESMTANLITLPYFTFAKGGNHFLINLGADFYGESEEGAPDGYVPNFAGMSGSWAYCYYPDSLIPYKCIGILSNGDRESGNLWVINISEVLNFIDQTFFS